MTSLGDQGAPPRRKSARFVTTGYHNALHRIFLYGSGLGSAELDRPIVGLAIASNEAMAGSGAVRALGDAVGRQLWRCGAVPREFVVPVVDADDLASDVVTRELAADSVELVVRGHWHDALVGVAASPAGVAGLAMAALRLRVPAAIIVPEQAGSGLAGLVAAARSLGIAAAASPDEPAAVAERLRAVLDEVLGPATPAAATGPPALAGRPVELPRVADARSFVHAAAMLHEVGVTSLRSLLLAPSSREPGALERDRPIAVTVVDGERGTAFGLTDTTVASTWSPGASVVEDGDRLVLMAGQVQSDRGVLVEAVDGDLAVEVRPRLLLDAALASKIRQHARRLGRAEVSIAPGPAATTPPDGAPVLSCATLGRVAHPGPLFGGLAYDAL